MKPIKNIFKRIPAVNKLYSYINDLEKDREQLKIETALLRKDFSILEQNFAKVERERDGLFSELQLEQDKLRTSEEGYKSFVPPGHYYSPIPSIAEIKEQESLIFDKSVQSLPAINLNEIAQFNLLETMVPFFSDWLFPKQKEENLRYYSKNGFFENYDALILFCLLRILKPKKIIEVGSGFSSALILDTNELFLNNALQLIFIEPYPNRLLEILREGEKSNINLIQKNLQLVPLEIFKELNEGDILFIDSTHVAKTGSDVNYILFNILPCLNKGVYIHFHDVIYPFEYPIEWVYEGRAWNEAYFLRAFLEYNNDFEIVFFADFVLNRSIHELKARIPLSLQNELSGCGSLWLRKL